MAAFSLGKLPRMMTSDPSTEAKRLVMPNMTKMRSESRELSALTVNVSLTITTRPIAAIKVIKDPVMIKIRPTFFRVASWRLQMRMTGKKAYIKSDKANRTENRELARV